MILRVIPSCLLIGFVSFPFSGVAAETNGSLTPPDSSSIELILKNASFESSFDNWSDINPSAIFGTTSKDDYSVKVSDNGRRIERSIDVIENTVYTMTAYIRGRGQIGVNVGSVIHSNDENSDDWVEVTLEFYSGAETSVTVFAEYANDEGHFDVFSETKADELNSIDDKSLTMMEALLTNASFESNFANWRDSDSSTFPHQVSAINSSDQGKRIERSFAVTENRTYVLTAYAKGSVQMGVNVGGSIYSSHDVSEGWSEIELEFESGNETLVTLFFENENNKGRFDGVSLKLVS